MIWNLKTLPESARGNAGGKAGTLARLMQAGYPVPPGFVISSSAFDEAGLIREARVQVANELARLRGSANHVSFAVRSSARNEDSAAASFAGEFESLLSMTSDEEVFQAIRTVYRSSGAERVRAYAEAQGVAEEIEMAVLVQQMVPAELAGVLFTADPVSGSHAAMTGNFIEGLGDRLVSGEATGHPFSIDTKSGEYDGPPELAPHARDLFKMARRLVSELGGPQDIEWAVAGGRLFVLQARPVTTMQPYNPATGEWNDSWRGEFLWSNSNFGEVLPEVMTPLTWSVVQIYGEETLGNPLPGDAPMMGNIAGRFYMNLSLFASLMTALGFSRERMNRESEEFFGNLPDDIDIPLIPFSRLALLRTFLPIAIRAAIRRRRNLRRLNEFTEALPTETAALRQAIEDCQTPAALADLWVDQLEPLLRPAYQMLQAGTSRYENAYRPLRRKLAEQVGEVDANLLLSGVSVEGEQLASLGPMVGLGQVARGELSRHDYLQKYGHRGPNEFELYAPRPAEDPGWMDAQLASLGEDDIRGLLARRESEKEAAWKRYTDQFPGDAADMERKLGEAAAAAREREAIRSEVTRLLGAARHFALRAGDLSGLGDGVFFLRYQELLAGLNGKPVPEAQIRARRESYERLSALPPYPALIVGRFDPYSWAALPNRRTDTFDARQPAGREAPASDLVVGLPGSAGLAEGTVRLLASVEEGSLLQAGEILVATTTNVGWTPLFPRAAAVVTDVGAPLSHAAIVARELGIPAVIGTGDATMRLKNGDRVRVDGARGTVQIL
ncbi:MAG: PEP/pyruvate-binding domain-containing protein [Anaerolineales bacterium]|nr:PEP/pyruvate-binding domain-containing protein [Anaerolineales bacterium]